MEIEIKKKQTVKPKTLSVHAKVRDCGTYTLTDEAGEKIHEKEGYVPGFFPEDHYNDYLILDIDLETGKINNWKPPTKHDLEDFCTDEDE